jgi:hypothetical protein
MTASLRHHGSLGLPGEGDRLRLIRRSMPCRGMGAWRHRQRAPGLGAHDGPNDHAAFDVDPAGRRIDAVVNVPAAVRA